jgi:hypothetical protein
LVVEAADILAVETSVTGTVTPATATENATVIFEMLAMDHRHSAAILIEIGAAATMTSTRESPESDSVAVAHVRLLPLATFAIHESH